jgi:hypothetical protein
VRLLEKIRPQQMARFSGPTQKEKKRENIKKNQKSNKSNKKIKRAGQRVHPTQSGRSRCTRRR